MKHTTTQFENTLALLRDPDAAFTAEAIRSLSDLSGADLHDIRTLWPELPASRRRDLLARLVDTAETNFEFDFGPIVKLGLHDPDEEVRQIAVEGVFEDSPHTIIERLMAIAQADPFSDVRAAAAKMLGMFILRGELGKLPDALNTRLQDTVLALYYNLDEAPDVRRRALEAIANCGREGIPDMIREAYFADDLSMRVSALFAMGRSCDPAWSPHILDELGSEYPEMRYEATRAAGELELKKALPQLSHLIYEDDREIQEMAIWAVGEIGGRKAMNLLTELAAVAEDTGDDELGEVVQEAQAAAMLVNEETLPLFDFSELDVELDEDEDEDIILSNYEADYDPYADDDDDDDGYSDADFDGFTFDDDTI